MAKYALLIGVGEYGEGLQPLPAAPKDVEALAAVLRDPKMGMFEDVQTLLNPTQPKMAETIELWFQNRQPDDLLLLFFSGHGVKDDRRALHFASSSTKKSRNRLVRSTATSARFLNDCIRGCKANYQVVVLDCCFSGAFGDLLARDDGTLDLQEQLGAEGRVVLTSTSAVDYSFEEKGADLSIYTGYLVEGITTGAADTDADGWISVEELHRYASGKVKETSPVMSPDIIALKGQGHDIKLARAPQDDPRLVYRREMEKRARKGKFSPAAKRLLGSLLLELGISEADAEAIKTEVLKPYRDYQRKLYDYREALVECLREEKVLSAGTLEDMIAYRVHLGLKPEDVSAIEQELTDSVLEAVLLGEIALDSLNISVTQDARNPQQQDGDNLASEKGVDYTRLRDLLEAGQWQEADQETAKQMLEAMAKESWADVTSEDLLNFPCADLKTIDGLRVTCSDGRFGFSVQKDIYVECGATLDGEYLGSEIWGKFCERVGWRRNGSYINYSQVTFDTSARRGHLPFGVVWALYLGGYLGCVAGFVWVGGWGYPLLSHRDL
ncbi:MAG: GUN4 domain-containing protein [Elainellaceae cyanobacterium]